MAIQLFYNIPKSVRTSGVFIKTNIIIKTLIIYVVSTTAKQFTIVTYFL